MAGAKEEERQLLRKQRAMRECAAVEEGLKHGPEVRGAPTGSIQAQIRGRMRLQRQIDEARSCVTSDI